ncbi:hypothetical protein [Helicobacter cinaedi]|uniref:hypothetical protein n=1 Tax=Helicobacter cinaedi TaxID=213 RepID=UPI0010582CC9|nr:hypothetical protein [Helicobacter cinaedi]
MQFFSQKSKIFANYSTIHAKQIILKAKTYTPKIPTTSNVGDVGGVRTDKANVGGGQKGQQDKSRRGNTKTPKRGKANVGQVQKHKTKVEKMCGAGQSRNAKTPTQSNANRAN